MWKTIIRRILVMIPQLFVLSLIIFFLAQKMPGDPFSGLITPETDPARIEELREQAGLNKPLPVQYVNWIKDVAQGDFGKSYTYKRSALSVATIRRAISIGIARRIGMRILVSAPPC